MSWWYYERKPKPKAADGIKAKSKRGNIGESWWSGRFISVLESFNIGARLQRGRSYARSGQVLNLDIKSGVVSAKVQGSSSRPYKIEIKIKIFSDSEWSKVEQAMSEQALFMAKLLAGEMPKEIEEAFRDCGLKLFPASTKDIESDCSCPDWSNPCKHIAATYYILAEQFDEDPFLIFEWRGRAKEELISNLRKLRSALPTEAENESQTQATEFAEDFPPLADCLNNFWQNAPEFATLRIHPQATEIPDAVLRQLGKTGITAHGKPLLDALIPAYRIMTERAATKAIEK
jgi:uncharacterized Zn finger protein